MVQTVKFQVENITRYGTDKAVIRLSPSSRFSYLAGQYVELAFGENQPRFYSIANAPGKDFIEIHIKDNMRGGAGTYAMQKLEVGEYLHGKGPYGSCVYKPSLNDIILIAGGMGISPLKAIAEEAIKQEHKAPLHLYWGANSLEDLYIDAELKALKQAKEDFFYLNTHTSPIVEKIAAIEGCLGNTDIYIAGPPDMITACAPIIVKKGADIQSIYCDQTEIIITASNKIHSGYKVKAIV